jgi:AcrR family transcriptional regulator
MRVSSTSANSASTKSAAASARRSPQQNRAELRRASFLQAAEQLFGSLGYEAVTMTAIAELAHASIGTLYDYFPDKPAIATAIVARYSEDSHAFWAQILQQPAARRKSTLADTFIQGILQFVAERPGYLPLLDAPFAITRTRKAREPLRKTIAAALQTLKPTLTPDTAFLHAQVIVEIMKGMLNVYRQASPKDQELTIAEFKKVMRLYLTQTLA